MSDCVAVIAAMERELSFLRSVLQPASSVTQRLTIGTIGSKEVVLLRTGVGPAKVRKRLAELAGFEPKCIFSIGCSGALVQNLQVGDIVISRQLVVDSAEARELTSSPELVMRAVECCESLGLTVHVGRTVTTAEVAATPDEKRLLAMRYGAISVDMESAHVANWAAGMGIPGVTLRAVSDELRDGIPREISTIFDTGGRLLLSKALQAFIARPILLFEIVRLKSRFEQSTRSLEQVVIPLIGAM